MKNLPLESGMFGQAADESRLRFKRPLRFWKVDLSVWQVCLIEPRWEAEEKKSHRKVTFWRIISALTTSNLS